MARIRTIKPEFWQDEKLAPLAPIHRLVFLGLISQADDAGRLVDSPRLLNGLIFPSTEDDCSESIEILASLGRVLRYTSHSGQQLLQVVGWPQHQRVVNPSRYNLPDPPPQTQSPQTVKPDYLEPNEDVVTPELDPKSPTVYHLPSTIYPTKDAFEGDFKIFWERYPLKVGKKAALKAYQARRRAGAEPEAILDGLTRYLAFKTATQERHHNPATFLGPNEWWSEPWTIPEAKEDKRGNGPGECELDPKFKKAFVPIITERVAHNAADTKAGNVQIELPERGGP